MSLSKAKTLMDATTPFRSVDENEDEVSYPLRSFKRAEPLMMIEIVSLIFEMLDTNSLGICRRVNSFWYEQATPLFRAKTRISLGTHTDPTVLAGLRERAPNLTPMSEVNYILPPEPLSKHIGLFMDHGMNLTSVNLPAVRFEEEPEASNVYLSFLDQLLMDLCPNLEHLTLTFVKHLSFGNVTPLQPRQHHSKLKSLRFQGGDWTFDNRSRGYAMQILSRIFERAPSIAKVHINFHYDREIMALFLSFIKDRCARGLTDLKGLQVGLDVPIDFNILNTCPLNNLKFFRLNSKLSSRCMRSLEGFLEKISGSLETLILDGSDKIDNWYRPVNVTERHPFVPNLTFRAVMRKLVYFEISEMESFDVGNISFLRLMPNLRTLVFREVTGGNAVGRGNIWKKLIHTCECEPHDTQDKPWKMEHLETLRLHGAIFFPSDMALASFRLGITHFPKLKTFQTVVCLGTTIFGFASFLETLTKLECLEELHLGFTESHLLVNYNDVKNAFVEALQNNIPQMDKLRYLELSLDDMPSSQCFLLTSAMFFGMFCGRGTRPFGLEGIIPISGGLTLLKLNKFGLHPEDLSIITRSLRRTTIMQMEMKTSNKIQIDYRYWDRQL